MTSAPEVTGVRALLESGAGRRAGQLSLLDPPAAATAARWTPLPLLGPDGARLCVWCGEPIPNRARRDSLTCTKRCRQARHRFGAGLRRLAPAKTPMRVAYADPPYPGLAGYYRGHKDFGGEVDHRGLLERLVREFPDGWALSTNARSLQPLLGFCTDLHVEVRVGAWLRGARSTRSRWPLSGWEPVIYAGGRRDVPSRTPAVDALFKISRPRRSDPERVIGAKPADFVWWLFELLGVRPGDELDDLFPGSHGVGRAFAMLQQAAL